MGPFHESYGVPKMVPEVAGSYPAQVSRRATVSRHIGAHRHEYHCVPSFLPVVRHEATIPRPVLTSARTMLVCSTNGQGLEIQGSSPALMGATGRILNSIGTN